MQINMRHTHWDVVTASEHNNINTIISIGLGDKNDMQDDVDMCEYDSNTMQQENNF